MRICIYALIFMAAADSVAANPLTPHGTVAYFEEQPDTRGGLSRFLGIASAHSISVDQNGLVTYLLPRGTRTEPFPLTLQPVGARSGRPEGTRLLPSATNLYTKAAGEITHSRLRHWAGIRISGLYPGIEVTLEGRPEGFELAVRVAPGANPRLARFRYGGAERIRVCDSGELEVFTVAGSLRYDRPLAFQEDGSGTLSPVAAAFRVRGNDVWFDIGNYDRRRPLLIDPTARFSTTLGGDGFDAAYAVGVSNAGNVILAGQTDTRSFPGTTNTTRQRDVFITKLSSNGSSIEYTTILSGTGQDSARALAIDGSGRVVVAGVTTSRDFPVTSDALQRTHGGLEEVFVARLDVAGTLQYATYLGAGGTDVAAGVGVDAADSIYVAGYTGSLQFPVSSASFQTKHRGGGYDAFVAKIDSAGALAYSTLFGGTGHDLARAVTLAKDGQPCIAGYTESPDLNLVAPAQSGRGGGGDAMIACFSPDGSRLVYSSYLGGIGSDDAMALAADSTGYLYVTGTTLSIDFPGAATGFQSAKDRDRDAFLTKLPLSGGAPAWATYLGGSASDVATGLVASDAGDIWISGYTTSLDFPVRNSADAHPGGSFDVFAAKIDASGRTLLYSTVIGGSADDRAMAVSLDPIGKLVWLAGYTNSFDWPGTAMYPRAGYDVLAWAAPASEFARPAGDLDGNGQVDLVWQSDANGWATVNYYGGPAGTAVIGWEFLSSVQQPDRSVVAMADLDRDGHSDVLWRNADGSVVVESFGGTNGAISLGVHRAVPSPGSHWELVGTGDFDSDGHVDLVWQHELTRSVVLTYLTDNDGTSYLGQTYLRESASLGWRVVAVTDMDSDGKLDLLWQDDATRNVTVHYYGGKEGITFLGWGHLRAGGGEGWRVIVPK